MVLDLIILTISAHRGRFLDQRLESLGGSRTDIQCNEGCSHALALAIECQVKLTQKIHKTPSCELVRRGLSRYESLLWSFIQRREKFISATGIKVGFNMYERMLMDEMNQSRIDDLFVGIEVVPKVKFGYCSPFQLEKNN